MQLPDNLIAVVQIAVFHPEMPVFIEDLSDGIHGQPVNLELGLSQGQIFQLNVFSLSGKLFSSFTHFRSILQIGIGRF